MQVHIVRACVCSYPASQQQPGAVGCSIVSEAHSDAIFGQLVRVSSTHDMVSFNLCIGNLEERGKVRRVVSFFNMSQHEYRSLSQSLTWQQRSLLENLTIIRYFGVLYLFLSCTTRRLRAKKSVFPSVELPAHNQYQSTV